VTSPHCYAELVSASNFEPAEGAWITPNWIQHDAKTMLLTSDGALAYVREALSRSQLPVSGTCATVCILTRSVAMTWMLKQVQHDGESEVL
jgi:hypothetical protein